MLGKLLHYWKTLINNIFITNRDLCIITLYVYTNIVVTRYNDFLLLINRRPCALNILSRMYFSPKFNIIHGLWSLVRCGAMHASVTSSAVWSRRQLACATTQINTNFLWTNSKGHHSGRRLGTRLFTTILLAIHS